MSVTIKEPYVMGEKPAPLVYAFLDASGNPIDVTGWAAEFHIQERFGSPIVLTASIASGASGQVEHVWTGLEFPTPGKYTGQFWVGNGTFLYASTAIYFHVAAPVGTTPLL